MLGHVAGRMGEVVRGRDFKRLAAAFIALHPEYSFVPKGSIVALRPVGSILRGFCFEGSSDPDSFYLWAFVLPLYVPDQVLNFAFGDRITSTGRGNRWHREEEPGLAIKVARAMLEHGLPIVVSANSVTEMALGADAKTARLAGRQDIRSIEVAAYSWARAGEVERAGERFDLLLSRIEAAPKWSWLPTVANRAIAFQSKLHDPEETQRQLDEWEKNSATKLRLEKLRPSSALTELY
jgi:hypothetical protein